MPRLAFLAWGDFNARSRFARSTIPEQKIGTTRSLPFDSRGEKEDLTESHQAFEIAVARTSGLVNLVSFRQTGFFFYCKHLFIDKPMVITEPAIASKHVAHAQKRSYSSHLESFSKKIEQETEKLCRQGEVLVILK